MPKGSWVGARRGGGGGGGGEGSGVVVRPWRETQAPIGGFQRPLRPQNGFGPGVSGLAWRDVGATASAWPSG